MSPKRAFFATEVVQTSSMDCGPAALKCLLEGLGIPVSYGRLREACQTDVDGTSIDTLEDVANAVGLEAEQLLVPPEHVLMDEADVLPAIVMTRLANGFLHFIVVWRRHGGFVQCMDPAVGRRWLRVSRLREQLHVHGLPVPVDACREYLGSPELVAPLTKRLERLGCAKLAPLLDAAVQDPRWEPLAALDASTRMVETLVRAGSLSAGDEAEGVLRATFERSVRETPGAGLVPDRYWMVLPDGDDAESVLLKGTPLVRVRKRETEAGAEPETLSPELAAALSEPPLRPWHQLVAMLRDGGYGLAAAIGLLIALVLSVLGSMLEVVLLRGLMEVGSDLGVMHQRVFAAAALLVFLLLLLGLELPATRELQRLGRHVEVRLRIALLEKLPRLPEAYLRSRPVSDMAGRSHSLQLLRAVPELAGRTLRVTAELTITTAAIIWLDPGSAPLALLALALAVSIPAISHAALRERDLRAREHAGGLSRFYLDALLGLMPIRAHAAERGMRREHESLLVEWARASGSLLRAAVASDAVQSLVGSACAAGLIIRYVATVGDVSGVLVLAYWALQLPVLGQQLTTLAQQLAAQRNVALRLLEPLGAPSTAVAPVADDKASEGAAEISFEGVEVVAGGHTILRDLDLHIAPGSHVAIVGPSGAGKSSLAGLLLGWHRPARGRVVVDGRAVDGETVDWVRAQCAWVDPGVQLWNRSVLDNVRYGASDAAPASLSDALSTSDVQGLLERLPEGLQTTLGEGGALVSGGEGQRLRFARALQRTDARLVILDEPFRGLDRGHRRSLMKRARAW